MKYILRKCEMTHETIESIAGLSGACISNERVRYRHLCRKDAFALRDELQAVAPKKIGWRVGICIRNRILFDIDSHDFENIRTILDTQKKLHNTKFYAVRTLHGYHLISEKVFGCHEHWKYHVCLSLYKNLKKDDVIQYVTSVKTLYDSNREEKMINGHIVRRLKIGRDEFCEYFRKSNLYDSQGDFDVMHTINAMLYDRYVIRVSKKDEKEKTVYAGLF